MFFLQKYKLEYHEYLQAIKEVDGWYLINLGNGTSGWILAKYAEKS